MRRRWLRIDAPEDYWLPRDVCSYGYFLLAPNRWDPEARTLTRPLDLGGSVATLRLGQERRGGPVLADAGSALSLKALAEAERQIVRMLRLDDDAVGEFHRVDPRWAPRRKPGAPAAAHAHSRGRGRLFRSPSFFEDLIKTVTSCNVAWPSTVTMNRRLCEVFGPAFPSAARLARARPSTLRARCRVGYRDRRIVALARLVSSGEVDPGWFEDPSRGDEEVFERLLSLPGLGPYSAGNVMQLLGRYSRLALDTESIRHGKEVLGLRGTDRAILKRIAGHYEPFGDHRFRSYWFEIWEWYEGRKGPAWTWHPDRVGSSFTAAQYRRDARAAREQPPGVRSRQGRRPAARAAG